jgi:hypothetical protein
MEKKQYKDSVNFFGNGSYRIEEVCPIPVLEFIPFFLDRELIEKCDTNSVVEAINSLHNQKSLPPHSLVFGFSGYEHDSKEIYHIPEIRTWLQKLMVSVPHLFYFLCAFQGNMQFIYFCLIPVLTEIRDMRTNTRWCQTTDPTVHIENIIKAATEFSLRTGETIESQLQLKKYILEGIIGKNE